MPLATLAIHTLDQKDMVLSAPISEVLTSEQPRRQKTQIRLSCCGFWQCGRPGNLLIVQRVHQLAAGQVPFHVAAQLEACCGHKAAYLKQSLKTNDIAGKRAPAPSVKCQSVACTRTSFADLESARHASVNGSRPYQSFLKWFYGAPS